MHTVQGCHTSRSRRRPGRRARQTCPGGDRDYADLLSSLFDLKVGNVYIQLTSEKDRRRVLQFITIFVGVTDPINTRVETPEEVRDRLIEAAEFIPPGRLGTTDDCGCTILGSVAR